MFKPFLLLCASLLAAHEVPNLAPRPTLVVPQAVTVPLMTAAADDPAWAAAALIANLQPAYNQDTANHDWRPDQRPATEVRVLWTANLLFVRFTAQDDDLSLPFDRRDADLYNGDVAELFLDPSGDGRALFEIGGAPNGAVYDTVTLYTGNDAPNPALAREWADMGRDVWFDRNWNLEGLQCAASRSATGWTVDLAVPAKGLLRRLGTETFSAGQRLRANVLRYDWPLGPDGQRHHLPLDWSPTAAGRPHLSPAALGTFELAP
jgi:hypothetical protein